MKKTLKKIGDRMTEYYVKLELHTYVETENIDKVLKELVDEIDKKYTISKAEARSEPGLRGGVHVYHW